VQILDDDYSRALSGQHAEELDPGRVQALARDERMLVGRRLHSERHTQDLAVTEPGPDRVLRVALQNVELASQHLSEGPIRDPAAIRKAASGVPRRLRRLAFELLRERVEQPRLAHARIAHDRDEVRLMPLHHPPVHRLQDVELVPTPDEGAAEARDASRPCQPERADEAPADDTACLALRRHGRRLAELEGPLRRGSGALADQDLARLGRLLEPRRHVDSVARDEGASLPRPTDNDLARVDADAECERTAEELLAAAPDRKRGVQCTFRMILVGSRRTERGHDGIPGELLHRAAGRLDFGGYRVVVALEQSAGSLRVLLSQFRRSDKVDEERRRELPLGLRPRIIRATLGRRGEGRLRA
jgi:hypothetical protein